MLGAGTAEKEADFNPIGALHAKMAGRRRDLLDQLALAIYASVFNIFQSILYCPRSDEGHPSSNPILARHCFSEPEILFSFDS